MTGGRQAILAAAGIGLMLAGSGDAVRAQNKAKPASHTITIDASSFSPATLTIKTGDTVTWVNKDIIPHTATDTAKGGFDSGTMKSGASWKRTFTTKGDHAYICSFHPTMKGRLEVK